MHRGANLAACLHAVPFRGGLRRTPPQVAHRRRGEGDAAINGQPVLGCALNHASIDFYRRGSLGHTQPATSLLPAILPLFSRQLQLPLPLGVDLPLTPASRSFGMM